MQAHSFTDPEVLEDREIDVARAIAANVGQGASDVAEGEGGRLGELANVEPLRDLRIPGTVASLGRKSSMIVSTSFFRWLTGLSRTRTLPELLAALTSLNPTVDRTPTTFGSARMRSTICS